MTSEDVRDNLTLVGILLPLIVFVAWVVWCLAQFI